MNDKKFFQRDSDDSVFREFVPLQEVMNAGASFVAYELFIDRDSSQLIDEVSEVDDHVE